MRDRSEWENLLAAAIDGPANAARNRRLNALLRSDPALREEYLQHLQVHALLQWRTGQAQPRELSARLPAQRIRQRARIFRTPAASVGWGLVAAVLLLAVGVGTLLLFPSAEARATPDVVERLIDWNL